MKKRLFIISILLLIVSVVFTVLVAKVDVKPIGPENSSVGLSTLNQKLTPSYDEKYYKISKYLGYAALIIPVIYAGIGAYQLIKNKSLAKVDKRLYTLAIFYVIVLATYVLFEKVVINYRPVILDEGLEASYPSSHTLMSIFFTISAVIINKEMFNSKLSAVNVLLFLLGASIMAFRAVSGVHWFTDIVGSLLIGLTLLTLFKAFIKE